MMESVTRPSAARKRPSRSWRASMLLPTCTSVPSGSRSDMVSSVDGSQPSGHAEDQMPPVPRSTTRTNNRSGAVSCSALTVSLSARKPPRL